MIWKHDEPRPEVSGSLIHAIYEEFRSHWIRVTANFSRPFGRSSATRQSRTPGFGIYELLTSGNERTSLRMSANSITLSRLLPR